jgi:NAD kinase
MMAQSLAPRVVVVSRHSELTELLGRHGTKGAAGYYLKQRGRRLDEVESHDDALELALTSVSAAIPPQWRRGAVDRADLSRFLFAPEDIVVAVGQDGLVANVAKYLSGQPVVGVDPEPGRNAGVLVRFPADELGPVLAQVHSGRAALESRTMVQAYLDDGQQLTGLNEIYVGHGSHQSARYSLSTPDGQRERQSSSGVVVGTGTGATGWCASIARERAAPPRLPDPVTPQLCWFVREAWPSPSTGVRLTEGLLEPLEALEITSEGEQLVCFADGIEDDRLMPSWGQRITITLADNHLNLVVPTAIRPQQAIPQQAVQRQRVVRRQRAG